MNGVSNGGRRRAAVALTLLLTAVAGAGPMRAARLPLRSFRALNGLGDDLVWVVRQDSRGLLWFGTGRGLSRFDGTSFRVYGTQDGLAPGGVVDVLETREGELLFAGDGGVCRLLPVALERPTVSAAGRRLFDCVTPGASPESASVRVLYQSRSGEVWAGTGDGLFRRVVRGGHWSFERVPLGLPVTVTWKEGIRAIVEEPDGALWLGTALGLARRSPDGVVSHVHIDDGEDDRVFALLRDRHGRLWIGHVDRGLFVWMPPAEFLPAAGASLAPIARPGLPGADGRIALPSAAGEAIRISQREGLDDDRVRQGLLEEPDGTIWIGTVRGLARFADGRLEGFNLRNGLSDEGMRPSVVDSSGNVWFGSPSGGAMRLRHGGLTTYDESDGLEGVRIRSVFESGGALFVLTARDRDYVHRFDGERFTAVAPRLPPGNAYTGWWDRQVALLDREGSWWLPTADALLRFPRLGRFEDLATVAPRAYRRSDGLPSALPQVLYEDRDGDVWIGSFAPRELGVWRRATGRFEAMTEASGIPRDAPTAFREDTSGRLWIGFGNGVFGWWRDGRLVRVPLGPQVTRVYDLMFDAEGRLWVATAGGGLVRIDHPSAPTVQRRYTTADGLGTDDVSCVASDLLGRIYACAGRGIDRLDPASGRVRRFDVTDGLANEQVKTAWRDAGGDLWFGTMLGLSRLHVIPDPKPGAARALVTGLEIDGAPVALPETGATRIGGPRFAFEASRLRVAFAAPGADLDAEPAYRYRLSPAENAWSAPSHDRSVTYAGLRPGHYRFSVQVVSGGVATGPAAIVELAVLPPWWRTSWALAALVALVVAAAYALHRQRVARLLAIERVRSRIAADLHDDLGASLTRIAVLSELARRKGGEGAGAPELRQIADTARHLTDEASDIVWSIDPHHDDLASLLARLRRLASDLLDDHGIALDFVAPPDAEGIRLSADQRRHLLMMLKEALHNAARHAGARRVEVRIEATGSAVLAVVRDDGRGFDVATAISANGGRGLPNLRARARALGGAVDVRSEAGAGTTVTLSMPR